MSFYNIRNEKGISKKRAAFSSTGDEVYSTQIMDTDMGAILDGGAIIMNMEKDGSCFATRKGARKILNVGEADAFCFDDGKYVFKQGAQLFICDVETAELVCVRNDLPMDEKCVIYHLYGFFAAFCEGGSVYTVSDAAPFESEASSLYLPIVYKLTVDKQEKMENINFLTEYCRIYAMVGMGNKCELPKDFLLDPDFYEVETTAGMALDNNAISLEVYEDGGATIWGRSLNSNLYITVRLKHDENGIFKQREEIDRAKALFFSNQGSFTFSGTNEGRANIVCYGGSAEKYLGVFSIDKKFYVPKKDILLHENTERITSVLRYSDDHLVFSPHYIRRMILSEDENAEKRFSVNMENFKYDVGCDIPQSAVCADDKIIYANSAAGVFYVDRFGFSQRDMSRNVSANIERGTYGLFEFGKAELENAQAVICAGKYYLYVGGIFYIWDFLCGVPSSGTEKISESRKMYWTLASGISCKKILGSDINKFYFITENDEICVFGEDTDAENVESFFKSESASVSHFGKACVFKLSLAAYCAQDATVRCYFDGKESSAKYTLAPSKEQTTIYEILPEKRSCKSFAFSISSNGKMRIEGAEVKWY